MYQHSKSSESKVKFRQASNCYKRVFEAAKLPYATKTKSLSLPRNLALGTFGKLLIVFVLNKGKSAIPLLFNGPEVLSSVPDKAKLFLKTFLRTLILMTGVSLYPSFLLELIWNYSISITPKMVKKVITNLDSLKASGPNCIPVVVLQNCASELSYILTELFNMCLKEYCFPDCWKVPSVVPAFKNVGEKSTAKN